MPAALSKAAAQSKPTAAQRPPTMRAPITPGLIGAIPPPVGPPPAEEDWSVAIAAAKSKAAPKNRWSKVGVAVVEEIDLDRMSLGGEETASGSGSGPVSYTHLTLPTIYSV